MPRPPTSGYARIAQAEEEEEEEPYHSDEDNPFHDAVTTTISQNGSYAPIQPKRRERMHIPSGQSSPSHHGRRKRANSGVDIKAINARLERWADEIKDRFKIRRVKGKSADDEHLEIHHSVFQAPEWIRPYTKEQLDADHYSDVGERISKIEFDDMVESVRVAIELGKHPTLIAQGSSGSYFVRNTKGKVLGVFKPKDEEPYASKNPKWTKWIHRNLFPFFFGRACLIPNLSYVSEAAAYVLDCQLRTNIVPYTEVVSLSSKSFFYDFWDRRAFYRKGKPLPEKQGSFQVFLKGYKGATEFFKEHPWPDQHNTNFRDAPRRKRKTLWAEDCRPKSRPGDSDDEEGMSSRERSRARHEFWSEALQESFREQLEKLVILDYIMRNTDRGTDNWMIRIDSEKQTAEIVARPPKSERQQNGHPDPSTANAYNRRQENMTAAPSSDDEDNAVPRLGAIDNSLSWPWKHPDAWRSYPFGWLFLPVSLIGRPFTDKTKHHFLPLLTSKEWWTDTQVKLRNCFELDADFKERMFARQIAVMKGQAWNVVETLKTPDHGPLELTRRNRVCVWDDLVDIPVAVPMSRPSEEMRQQARDLQSRSLDAKEGRAAQHEEMDISAAYASAPAKPQPDLLGFGPDLDANENPFNSSRQNSSDTIPQIRQSGPELGLAHSLDVPASASLLGNQRPVALRSSTVNQPRMSYDVPSTRQPWHQGAKRRSSFAVRRIALGEDGDDEDGEGDLGFGAARDQEGSRRKVIVERLEMVKSKPPVFTWC